MKIRNFFIIIILAVLASSCSAQKNQIGASEYYDNDGMTNYFFDNSPINELVLPKIYVDGEVANPGLVDFDKLVLHEMIVKETLLEDGKDTFIGAYRYVGYSLADILNLFTLEKINAEAFPPIVDLYVEIENDKGDKIVASWGEIYFSNNLDDIILASGVARIIPEKSKDMWVLPTESKMVFMDDIITARNISNPVKITVKSYKNNEIEIIKGKDPNYSPIIEVKTDGVLQKVISENYNFPAKKSVHTIFYGKGRGLHGTEPHEGYSLNEVLSEFVEYNTKNLQKALIVVVADDGYRTVFSWSEVCNRNDQADIILMCNPELTNNGIFRIYPSCDFFSDRSIKGVEQIIIAK